MTVHVEIWMIWLIAMGLVIGAILIWRLSVVPVRTAMRGMDLISSQDLNTRLRKTGEPHADKIVRLFNTMIDRLHGERLQNLERESFLNLLVEASPIGIAILDFDGSFALVNPYFRNICGLNPGIKIHELKPENSNNPIVRTIWGLKKGETALIRMGDINMWRASRLFFYEKGFQKEFFLLEPMTEEIKKAEKDAYGKVIRAISHEVNNTLGGIRSVLGLMAETEQDEETARVLESCDIRCARLSEFIRAYADVVRVPEPVLRECDLMQVLAAIKPFLQSLVTPRISVTLENESAELPVFLDEYLFEQVLVNVVRNASDSIDGDGEISLIGAIEGKEVVLTISDNGTPIPEDVQKRLFTPFFSTKTNGKGIGLTLSSEILRQHHASFSLKSDSDGWTRFTIRLPLRRH